MTAKVLVVGLDAAESTLIEQWAKDGLLPNFSSLIKNGSVCHLQNSLETLPGAIWPELSTGRSCGQKPLYYHSRQLHTGEARLRPIEPEDEDPNNYVWNIASRVGRRVAVIDQPQTVPSEDFDGVSVFEWGLHDRSFNIQTQPTGLLQEIIEKYGHHPITHCDRHGENEQGYKKLLDGLLMGVNKKTSMTLDLLSREPWDLFMGTFGETHCVGHQFWHFLDAKHPKHDPDAPKKLLQAIQSVYRRIDTGLGKIMEAAGPQATVFVVASHGMGLYTGGSQLLPEVLVQLNLGSGNQSAISGWLRRFQIACSHVPRYLQPWMQQLALSRFTKGIQQGAGCLLHPLESSKTRAVSLRNNRCGAIRLNLRGREPYGQVRAGEDADALLDALRRELLALRQPDSGEPIVAKVRTAKEAFGPDHHPDVPDMMVVFRSDLGILESCQSERVDTIRTALYHPNIPRTGDHTVESRLWLKHSAVNPGTVLENANVLDIAPTILHSLGVDIPDTMDGCVLPEIKS